MLVVIFTNLMIMIGVKQILIMIIMPKHFDILSSLQCKWFLILMNVLDYDSNVYQTRIMKQDYDFDECQDCESFDI